MMYLNTTITAIFLMMVTAVPAAAETSAHFRIEAERTHQSFDEGDADIDTVTLAPSVDINNWTLSASLPWQHIDGSYFVNNLYPNLTYLCNQLQDLSGAEKVRLLQRGQITAKQVYTCNQTGGVISGTQSESVNGFSDLELFANYFLAPLSESVSGSVGIGYKHDNGDVETGLGTGTRDLFAETTWLFQRGTFSVLSTLGYQFVLQNNTDFDMRDYAYAAIDGRWQWRDFLALGAAYHYLQANAETLDDLDYLVWYVGVGRISGWGLRLEVTDYRDATGYPDKQLSGSVSYRF